MTGGELATLVMGRGWTCRVVTHSGGNPRWEGGALAAVASPDANQRVLAAYVPSYTMQKKCVSVMRGLAEYVLCSGDESNNELIPMTVPFPGNVAQMQKACPLNSQRFTV